MLFENPFDCFIIRSVVSEDQRRELCNWMELQVASGTLEPNSVSPHRFFRKASELDDLPAAYPELKRRLGERLGITDYADDNNLGDIVTCNEAGARIHVHIDDADREGRWHLRVNLYLQAAAHGGDPVLQKAKVNVREGEAWAFIANTNPHWSTPTMGDTKRYTFSYAMMIDPPEGKLAQIAWAEPRFHEIEMSALPIAGQA